MAKFCKNCGYEMNDNAYVCVKCGVKADKPVGTSSIPGSKSKLAAGLLGIFLGAFGVHNFYLGYTGKALAQVLLTVLSCFILSPVTAIWGLIEGIMILTGNIDSDAEGRKLTD